MFYYIKHLSHLIIKLTIPLAWFRSNMENGANKQEITTWVKLWQPNIHMYTACHQGKIKNNKFKRCRLEKRQSTLLFDFRVSNNILSLCLVLLDSFVNFIYKLTNHKSERLNQYWSLIILSFISLALPNYTLKELYLSTMYQVQTKNSTIKSFTSLVALGGSVRLIDFLTQSI